MKYKLVEVIKVISYFLMIIPLFIGIPLSAIWSVNTLFNTQIPFNTSTYLASFVLCGIIGMSHVTKK
jgi:hypothetical protein